MSHDGADERADRIIEAFLVARADRSRKARRAKREADEKHFHYWKCGADNVDFGDWEDDWEGDE